MYALLIDEGERHALAAMQASAVLASVGAKGVKVHDPSTFREDVDRVLLAEAKQVAPGRRLLMDALGLARAG